MKAALRASRPPPWLVAPWAASLLAGAALLAGAGTGGASPQAGVFGPATLVGYLHRSLPPTARELRVNGVYGSGHAGAWQFVAHLSWLAADGTVHGGALQLPEQAGAAVAEDAPGSATLVHEQRIGWTPAQLSGVLGAASGPAAPLALLELEITDGDSGLVSCRGRGASASCAQYAVTGRRVRTFSDTFVDQSAAGPLSVQRAGKTLP
jgi:hypothetical protein